jgi:acetate kinase
MVLVIDYDLKELRLWVSRAKEANGISPIFIKNMEEVKDDKALRKYILSIAGKDKLRAIAFRILFGGDYFNKPAIVDPKLLERLGNLTDFFPFYIPSTLYMLNRFRNAFKNIPLIVFFETSFFLKLPDEEKYYALPFEYYKDNKIKKFGFHGIFHEANSGMVTSGSRIISIVFDKQTTVCAIHNKRPLSISLGYTPLEGIMSNRACGDLDPGIVFYLMNVHNFSIYEIDEMLKNKSGFTGLTGYDIELKDMIKLRGKDPKVDLAFDVYEAQIMKHIGEGISVLGGLDNIIIAGSNVGIFTPIIYDVIKKISFLGINSVRLPWDKDEEIANVTSEESKIKVYVNRKSLPAIIFHESEAFLRNQSI